MDRREAEGDREGDTARQPSAPSPCFDAISRLPTSSITLAVPVRELLTTVCQARVDSRSVGAMMFPDELLTIRCGRPSSATQDDREPRTLCSSATSQCSANTCADARKRSAVRLHHSTISLVIGTWREKF